MIQTMRLRTSAAASVMSNGELVIAKQTVKVDPIKGVTTYTHHIVDFDDEDETIDMFAGSAFRSTSGGGFDVLSCETGEMGWTHVPRGAADTLRAQHLWTDNALPAGNTQDCQRHG